MSAEGGPSLRQACDEFLASAVDIYQYLQQELMAADHIGTAKATRSHLANLGHVPSSALQCPAVLLQFWC